MKSRILNAALVIIAISGSLWAGARLQEQVTLVGQDDGNTRVGLAVTCTSSAWTAVVASRESRRLLKLHSLDTNSDVICLGTNDSENVCAASSLGIQLGTGDNYEDANEGALYCRVQSNSQVLKGFDLYDSRD